MSRILDTLAAAALLAIVLGILAGGIGLLLVGAACVKMANGFDVP